MTAKRTPRKSPHDSNIKAAAEGANRDTCRRVADLLEFVAKHLACAVEDLEMAADLGTVSPSVSGAYRVSPYSYKDYTYTSDVDVIGQMVSTAKGLDRQARHLAEKIKAYAAEGDQDNV